MLEIAIPCKKDNKIVDSFYVSINVNSLLGKYKCKRQLPTFETLGNSSVVYEDFDVYECNMLENELSSYSNSLLYLGIFDNTAFWSDSNKNFYIYNNPISKWDIRFLELATFISQWSKDQSTKTGAVVIGPDREIRATGYNGLCRGVNDDMPERQERPQKYDYFEHAERNAVYNACLTGTSLKGCVMYCTHAPCTDCARAIIQSGIKKVVTHKVDMTNAPTGTWRDKLAISRQMFEEAGVEYYEI